MQNTRRGKKQLLAKRTTSVRHKEHVHTAAAQVSNTELLLQTVNLRIGPSRPNSLNINAQLLTSGVLKSEVAECRSNLQGTAVLGLEA